MGILSKIFGDANKKYTDGLRPIIDQVNNFEPELEKLSDVQIKEKSIKLKHSVENGELTVDGALALAFALVREASKRTLKQRHFDEQLMCGIALHRGHVVEMKTGEGKTLAATLAVYLNALTGKGAHVVTVNDYLARRDAVWMGQIYDFLGLTIGCIQQQNQSFLYDSTWKKTDKEEEILDEKRDELGSFHVVQEFLRPCERRQAYAMDITYGTNNEYGFDYLRDNMVYDLSQKSQRGHSYGIVDEVDSILIDEARTPLIISQPDTNSSELYKTLSQVVPKLKENTDYNLDEKMRAVTLTEEGINHVEKLLGMADIYSGSNIDILHHLEQALQAEILFKRDKNYVVKDGEVIIVDDFTGRLMPGRRYSEGLHQAIEAKEGVEVNKESRTLATITFQNYFRLYKKLAGMTGTALTSAEEFHKVYKLDVTSIPTHRPLIRKDRPDSIYQTEKGKYEAIIRKIKECNKKGQPVLVGTISIEKNERLGALLKVEGIEHNLLNAKNHEREGEIIAQAGRFGAVTIATNMAGRGVDIVLGGNPFNEEEAKKVKEAGGLCVIGTERHEARRIDNQLRGRAGRQGDPGESQFFVSLEDDLMRVFGSDRIKNLMGKFGIPEDQPIENAMVSRALESAQGKIEGFHFDARKHVLEYDDVMNVHRETIYRKRNEILESDKPEETFKEYIGKEAEEMTNALLPEREERMWNLEELAEEGVAAFHLNQDLHKTLLGIKDENITPSEKREKIKNIIINSALERISKIREVADKEVFIQVSRGLLLSTIDLFWMEHLDGMEYLRDSVRLRAYGQRDPLVEYKNDGYQRFKELLFDIRRETLKRFFRIEIQEQPNARFIRRETPIILQGAAKTQDQNKPLLSQVKKDAPENAIERFSKEQEQKQSSNDNTPPEFKHVGRNDPCPCGSGKKFKKCCLEKYS
ncbi:MAG: preprotein translocase subunit SecA [Candidatus Paceibacterota bacterium]|jgi:preprotein translocase subunit SecA